MAKRQSSLYSFFQSPSQSPKVLKTNANSNASPVIDTPKRKQMKNGNAGDDDEDEIVMPKKRSRIQILTDSSDSDDEAPKSSKENRTLSKKTKKIPAQSSSDSEGSGRETKSKPSLKDFSFTNKTESKVDTAPRKKEPENSIPSGKKESGSTWLHNTLPFLEPKKIRDANKNKPDHPEYDCRTLFVPDEFLKGLTGGMRQWWELKSQHFDSVLFFKVGKFYELYHMDAVTGVAQLGLSFMRGEFAHSGFPETAYAKMAGILIEAGFKVARVEQTETPEMMDARCKKMGKVTKFDKVVRREICQVTARATCVYNAQMHVPLNKQRYYMYAVCMKQDASGLGNNRVGICFVETSTATFHLSEFDDDKYFSKLLALFAEYPPALILIERGGVSKKLHELLNTQFADIRKDGLTSKSQFYTAAETLEKLSSACYFRDVDGNLKWPNIFKKLAVDCLPNSEFELTLRSLGATMWYLKDSKLDIQVITAGKFEWYDPLNYITTTSERGYLILDAVTITNLNLLGSKDSLESVLDHCETPFGKRLLQRWICRPLCEVAKIKERQKAVNTLWQNPTLLRNTQAIFKKMPDLERQLTKIHTYGNRYISKNHPDGRAIFYEAVTYSKRKIRDFLDTLRAFERAQEIAKIFEGYEDLLLKKLPSLNRKA